ncbi:hypothetical protein [uncultured Devosia sp.]|uniref:hypothetical protein n=1 Tax=uncultured Devosia sp. TaxID=211434 RepID=UPI0035CACACA
MSNAAAIGPSVMINRIVDRLQTPAAAELAKVAELRMALQTAVEEQTAESALASPTGIGEAPVIDNGAAVDRLI